MQLCFLKRGQVRNNLIRKTTISMVDTEVCVHIHNTYCTWCVLSGNQLYRLHVHLVILTLDSLPRVKRFPCYSLLSTYSSIAMQVNTIAFVCTRLCTCLANKSKNEHTWTQGRSRPHPSTDHGRLTLDRAQLWTISCRKALKHLLRVVSDWFLVQKARASRQ